LTYFPKQEQQRVAVGPGNTHFISIRQVLLVLVLRPPPLLLLCICSLIIKK